MKRLFLIINAALLVALFSCSSDNATEEIVVEVPTVPENPNEPVNPTIPTRCGNQSTVSDIDGNVYKIVQIGYKCWLQTNLRTSRYNDGQIIVDAQNNPTNLSDSLAGKYYNRDNEQQALKLCPEGWHVATEEDWADLGRISGNDAGSITRAIINPNYWWQDANNRTGFSAVETGSINRFRQYVSGYAFFWNSTYSRSTRMLNTNVYQNFAIPESTVWFVSCRCVRDN